MSNLVRSLKADARARGYETPTIIPFVSAWRRLPFAFNWQAMGPLGSWFAKITGNRHSHASQHYCEFTGSEIACGLNAICSLNTVHGFWFVFLLIFIVFCVRCLCYGYLRMKFTFFLQFNYFFLHSDHPLSFLFFIYPVSSLFFPEFQNPILRFPSFFTWLHSLFRSVLFFSLYA